MSMSVFYDQHLSTVRGGDRRVSYTCVMIVSCIINVKYYLKRDKLISLVMFHERHTDVYTATYGKWKLSTSYQPA